MNTNLKMQESKPGDDKLMFTNDKICSDENYIEIALDL